MLAELEKLVGADAGPDDAYTTDEWAAKLGLGLGATRVRLQAAAKAGRLEIIPVYRNRFDDVQFRTKAFRLLPAL
ncbi:MAG: hypothetical protein V3S14_13890 [Anaerolineae bacterium]